MRSRNHVSIPCAPCEAIWASPRADGLDLSANRPLDGAAVTMIRDAGPELHVWTVNDPAVARRMVALGVDSITTNRPGWLREQLAAPRE